MLSHYGSVDLRKLGAWGPVTATLDWCEPNHMFSHYIAEVANSFSNFYTIFLAVYGASIAIRERLPHRFLIGYCGVAMVGIGSFIFHSTLLWEAQLADELPMIYVASYSVWSLGDDQHGFNANTPRIRLQSLALVAFDVLFTWGYYLYRNPVYHQVVFATLMIIVGYRTAYLLYWSPRSPQIPDKKKKVITRIYLTGVLQFLFGFFVWNLDNIFCGTLTKWKFNIGWPLAFLLEGHSWWHVFTALGTYYMFVGVMLIALGIKDDHRNYILTRKLGLPMVVRAPARQD
ncbi:alkaline phytoceramidase [Schizophyllum commune H4-8]|uniref:Alkaline phytoceramidase n=1 Tax=Schizophyllum commune (strain H4-8 / FGSC 9210) TaxID=578458 RepID=D8PRQ0_SCHCM|nr:alkaline phytoceramidase [Schizophyllum commune H4-8]KAI5897969.1 alkaline phytoceramidase [Schizophyllum commune H4-8]